MKIPCKTCIVFAICKAKLTEAYNSKKDYVGWVVLKDRCSIINDLLFENVEEPGYKYDIILEVEHELRQIFGKVFGPSYAFQKRKRKPDNRNNGKNQESFSRKRIPTMGLYKRCNISRIVYVLKYSFVAFYLNIVFWKVKFKICIHNIFKSLLIAVKGIDNSDG